MGRIPSRGSDQFIVRFPDGMRDRIKAAADAAGRSMNAEIIQRLEDSFSEPLDDDVMAQNLLALGERLDRLADQVQKMNLTRPSTGEGQQPTNEPDLTETPPTKAKKKIFVVKPTLSGKRQKIDPA